MNNRIINFKFRMKYGNNNDFFENNQRSKIFLYKQIAL